MLCRTTKHCHCKKSKCLKLYCDCFAAGLYCNNCNCASCANTLDNECVTFFNSILASRFVSLLQCFISTLSVLLPSSLHAHIILPDDLRSAVEGPHGSLLQGGCECGAQGH